MKLFFVVLIFSQVVLGDTVDKRVISSVPPTPFAYETPQTLRLVRGMTKKDLLKTFGAPKSVQTWIDEVTFDYGGDVCMSYTTCSVSLIDGKVANWYGFKPEYTEDLN